MNKNIQPIEKADKGDGYILDVHSIFYTIQGEGPFTGIPAVFIRLAGCNLQCPGCDTDYTSKREPFTIKQILQEVLHHIGDKQKVAGGKPIIVITGGEPFRQNLTPLLRTFEEWFFKVQIETNGTLPPAPLANYQTDTSRHSGTFIVCSPKTGKVHPMILNRACALKYVLSCDDISPDDGLPLHALEHPANPVVARPPEGWVKPIYLQPMDSQDMNKNYRNLNAAIASCMQFGYTLQMQVHKQIDLP